MLDKELFQTKHSAIYDPEFQKHLADAPWKEWLSKPGYFEVRHQYLADLHNWHMSSKLNEVKGLKRFKQRDKKNGINHLINVRYTTIRVLHCSITVTSTMQIISS